MNKIWSETALSLCRCRDFMEEKVWKNSEEICQNYLTWDMRYGISAWRCCFQLWNSRMFTPKAKSNKQESGRTSGIRISHEEFLERKKLRDSKKEKSGSSKLSERTSVSSSFLGNSSVDAGFTQDIHCASMHMSHVNHAILRTLLDLRRFIQYHTVHYSPSKCHHSFSGANRSLLTLNCPNRTRSVRPT